MNLLIVDDEPLARAELLRLFAELLPDARAVEASNSTSARSALLGGSFDCVIVDMDLPGECGLDLIPDILAAGASAIIATAHERFAVDAFRVGALDYLLKPIELPRLFQAISRVPKLDNKGDQERLLLSDQSNCWPVKQSDITTVEADGSCCTVHFVNRKPVTICRSLKELEDLLGSGRFIRANRNQLVNLDRVDVIHRHGGGKMTAQLGPEIEVEFSRRQSQAFRSRFAV